MQRVQEVFDYRTPLYAGTGFFMGLSGVSPVSWIAMQLGFKVFSHTLKGKESGEVAINTLGDVSASFLAYLWGSNLRSKMLLTQGTPEVPPAIPKKQETAV